MKRPAHFAVVGLALGAGLAACSPETASPLGVERGGPAFVKADSWGGEVTGPPEPQSDAPTVTSTAAEPADSTGNRGPGTFGSGH